MEDAACKHLIESIVGKCKIDKRIHYSGPVNAPSNFNRFVVYLAVDSRLDRDVTHAQGFYVTRQELTLTPASAIFDVIRNRFDEAQAELLKRIDGEFLYDVHKTLESVNG